ncbi:hypothetical protein D3C72_1893350 [compost metagenome]
METQKNSGSSKIGLSKRALPRFLGGGNGNPTHEYFEIWSFHPAWGGTSRSLPLLVALRKLSVQGRRRSQPFRYPFGLVAAIQRKIVAAFSKIKLA